MLPPDLQRKNMLWGLALLGLSLVLLGGTVAVSFIYLALD